MRKGFTLVELLIVIIIIGILATMAVPQYNKMVGRAKAAEGIMLMGTILNGMSLYYAQYPSTTNFTVIPVGDTDVTWDTSKWPGVAPVDDKPFDLAAGTNCVYRIDKDSNIKVTGNFTYDGGKKEIKSTTNGGTNASDWQ